MARTSKWTVAGFGTSDLAKAVAKVMKAPYVSITMKKYAAGESYALAASRVRGRCLLVSDVDASPESIWNIVLASNALRHSGARSVTLIAPWIAYGRQDRPTCKTGGASGEALSSTLRSQFKRIITVSVHSPRFLKHFRGRLSSTSVTSLIVQRGLKRRATAIAAPDHGAVERAAAVAKFMKLPLIHCSKRRTGPGFFGVRSTGCIGDAKGHRVLLVDDMVDSGGTLKQAALSLMDMGAASVFACVTHIANPLRRPAAHDIGLQSLDILYGRSGKTDRAFVYLLAKSL